MTASSVRLLPCVVPGPSANNRHRACHGLLRTPGRHPEAIVDISCIAPESPDPGRGQRRIWGTGLGDALGSGRRLAQGLWGALAWPALPRPGRARPARPRQGPWGTLWGPMWDDVLANFPPVPGHFLEPFLAPQGAALAPQEGSKREAFGVSWGAFPGG